MCGGGGGVPPPPPPSATEEALNKEYLNLLQSSRRERDQLQPLIASESGYKPIYGADPKQAEIMKKIEALDSQHEVGWRSPERNALVKQLEDAGYSGGGGPSQVIVGYEPTEELQASQARAKGIQSKVDAATEQYLEIQGLQAERTKKALAGELPLSEGTMQRKKQEFDLLKEGLARAGNPIIGDDPGSAYSLTTAGSQALGEFNKRFGLLEDSERRGEITSGQAALTSGLGLTSDIGTRRTGQSSSSAMGVSNNFLGSASTLLPAYLQGQQPYQQQRGMEYQGTMQNSINRQQERAGYLNLAGTAIGSGAALYALSDRKAKKKIRSLTAEQERTATRRLSKVKLYKWNYKDEPEGTKQHLGIMVQDAPDEIVSTDKKHLDVVSYLGLLTGSVKELNRKIDSLTGRA